MNLSNFSANFGSKEFYRLHFKEERDKIGVQCKCRSTLILGFNVDGVMNAKNVEIEFH